MRKNIYHGLSNKGWLCHSLWKKQTQSTLIRQYMLDTLYLIISVYNIDFIIMEFVLGSHRMYTDPTLMLTF